MSERRIIQRRAVFGTPTETDEEILAAMKEVDKQEEAEREEAEAEAFAIAKRRKGKGKIFRISL